MIGQTHNVAMVQPIADFVVSIKNGRVFSEGSISQVTAKDPLLAVEFKEEEQALAKAEEEIDSPQPTPDKAKSVGKLIVAEEIEQGRVRWAACTLHPVPSTRFTELRRSEVVSEWHGWKASVHILLGVSGRDGPTDRWHHRADLVSGLLGITV